MAIETQIETDLAIPPGELLQEELRARGMTQKRLAGLMNRPPQAISEIIRGRKAITAETALALEEALEIPAYFWLRLEAQYRLILARQKQGGRRSA